MKQKNSEISQFFQRIIFSLFNLLIFLTPFVFTWLNQELFEFNKMIFVYGLTILIATVWIFRMVLEKRFIFKRTKFDYFLLAFFLSQLLSTLFSMHPHTSVFGYYTRFNGGLLSVISYITLFYAFVSNIEKKQINVILDSLLISSFLISLYAIPEHFGHSPSCLLITQKFDVACWVQKVQERVFATFGQPNWLAAYLISVIPINLSLLLKEKKTAKKIFLFFNLIAMTMALLFTRSRSGMLGLAIALAVFSLAKIFTSKKKERKTVTIKITGVALLMSFLVLLIGTPYTPNLKALINKNEIIETVEEVPVTNRLETGGTASEDIRKVVWSGALKVWKRYPLLGSGVETFAYSYYQDRPVEHNLLSEWDFLYNKAHNEILNFMATTGTLGLLSYLGLFVIFFYSVFKVKNEEESLAIGAAIIAMFISNVIGFSTVITNLLMFSYFAIIALYSAKTETEKVKIKDEKTDNFQFFFLGLTAIAASVLLNRTFKIWQADYLFTQGTTFCSQGNYQTGIGYIQKAIEKSPKEALFYDELGKNYSQLAIAFAEENESTVAAQLAKAAIESNEYALKLNPVHLNFHKSKARLFIRLAKLDRELYYYAKEALEVAITLSPTDAKLFYNLALVEEVLKNDEEAQKILEHTIAIKENYPQARNELARLYTELENFEGAQAQYQYILEKINPEDKLVQEKLRIVEASMAAKKE